MSNGTGVLTGHETQLYIGREWVPAADGRIVEVIAYDDEDHAVAIANDSRYGLSGSVWGPDGEHAKDVARRIRSDNVAVNQHTLDPAGPFGGFKQSGLGRENGVEGIEAYVELQCIPYVR
jgi:acyl-CoA reductase-like NAD-dependent aldehyde dehydrogenase